MEKARLVLIVVSLMLVMAIVVPVAGAAPVRNLTDGDSLTIKSSYDSGSSRYCPETRCSDGFGSCGCGGSTPLVKPRPDRF